MRKALALIVSLLCLGASWSYGEEDTKVSEPLNLVLPVPQSELLRTSGAANIGILQLEEVLNQVETTHPKLRGALLNQQIAAAKVQEKLGAFDPQLGVGSTYQRYNSSSTPGKPLDYVSNGIVVARTDPSGIKWEGGWLNTQGFPKSPASSTGDVGEFFVQAKVPFLRGAGINEKVVAVDQADLMEKRVLEDNRVLRLLTLLDAGSAFLQWNVSVMQWRILQENELLAVERARQVGVRIEAGDLPTIDQVEADTETAKRRELLLKAGRVVQKSALKLALYLWNTRGEPQDVPSPEQAPQELPPVQRIEAEEIYALQLEALAHRPEVLQLKLDKSIIELDKSLAENDRLPQLDLTLRPGYDVGGNGVGFTIKAGLELVIPLGTRGPDGRRLAAQLKLEKLDIDQVEMLRRILIQVQDAASELEGTAQRLEQASILYSQSKRLEEAERMKFRFGDSTLFLVNARERATLDAALKILELRHEHAQALLLLEAVVGKL